MSAAQAPKTEEKNKKEAAAALFSAPGEKTSLPAGNGGMLKIFCGMDTGATDSRGFHPPKAHTSSVKGTLPPSFNEPAADGGSDFRAKLKFISANMTIHERVPVAKKEVDAPLPPPSSTTIEDDDATAQQEDNRVGRQPIIHSDSESETETT